MACWALVCCRKHKPFTSERNPVGNARAPAVRVDSNIYIDAILAAQRIRCWHNETAVQDKYRLSRATKAQRSMTQHTHKHTEPLGTKSVRPETICMIRQNNSATSLIASNKVGNRLIYELKPTL